MKTPAKRVEVVIHGKVGIGKGWMFAVRSKRLGLVVQRVAFGAVTTCAQRLIWRIQVFEKTERNQLLD